MYQYVNIKCFTYVNYKQNTGKYTTGPVYLTFWSRYSFTQHLWYYIDNNFYNATCKWLNSKNYALLCGTLDNWKYDAFHTCWGWRTDGMTDVQANWQTKGRLWPHFNFIFVGGGHKNLTHMLPMQKFMKLYVRFQVLAHSYT